MDEQRERSRLDVLKAAGLAAGAMAGGSLLGAQRASAADGDPLTLGQANAATSKTSLATSGTISSDGAVSIAAANADYGVYASAAKYGLVGTGPVGVLGLGTAGGTFSGSSVAINLDPLSTAGSPSGQAYKGDMAVDSDGVLYLCVAAGTPGTWIRVSHGGVRYLASPQRAYDSRSGGGKLRAGAGDTANPRTISITSVVTQVPSEALGVVGNLAVTQEEAGGFATIWPSGAWPGTANINFQTGIDLSNSFSVGLSGSGSVNVAASANTHVVIDIAGYIL